MADSSKILQEKDGHWILPSPPDSVLQKSSITRHQKFTGRAHESFAGIVNQIVLHDSGFLKKEFYNFRNRDVLLLGTESRDSTYLFTIYEPPLVMLPRDVANLDSTFFCETNPKVWDATVDSIRHQQKTRLRLRVQEKGKIKMDSKAVPALLLKMTLSMDRAVGFGGTDLIVPDAIMMQSYVLFAETLGPVLEWGMLSREKSKITADETGLEIEDRPKLRAREYYIEVTLHRKI
ncbi:hypothetical protein JW935_00905 [candidate division KSB1 bacterium]|nr:hypothetical protein [candidate division KSB1 bacterium]